MRLLEYESKNLLKRSSLPVPKSKILRKNGDIPFLPAVLKSQVPVGGRGKAGGIRIIKTESEFQEATEILFSLDIKGYQPKILLAEELLEKDRELYLSLVINKSDACIELIAHNQGGVEVEDNKDFLVLPINKETVGVRGQQLAEYYDLEDQAFVLQDILEHLYDCFVKNDALLVEINPLVLTAGGLLVAADCKMELDDAATFRHEDWDFENKPANSNFVTLNQSGVVATIANGAGLAMATVDAVVNAGLSPANFLDIGGGASKESVLKAFQQIAEYPNVKVIVINIFAGITRCDEVAKAIIAAKHDMEKLPVLFIRLSGTNFQEAVDLLDDAGITTLPNLEACLDAAKKEIIS